jgi:hypothetical protein
MLQRLLRLSLVRSQSSHYKPSSDPWTQNAVQQADIRSLATKPVPAIAASAVRSLATAAIPSQVFHRSNDLQGIDRFSDANELATFEAIEDGGAPSPAIFTLVWVGRKLC